jgi:hypothetical protein
VHGHELDVVLMGPDAEMRRTRQRVGNRRAIGNKKIGGGMM